MKIILNRSYFDFSIGDFGNEVFWTLFVDGASDWKTGAQDLFDGAGETFGHWFFFDYFGDLFHLFQSEVSFVSDVLHFLSISFVVAELFDDKGWWSGVDDDFSGSVLTFKLNHDSNTFPLSSFLDDVFTDFFSVLILLWDVRDPRDLI